MASVGVDGVSIKVGYSIIFDIGHFMAGTESADIKEPHVGRNT
jgi:hypothetical protein